jgi:formylglycine-generating enzyme required for sulfatase activity
MADCGSCRESCCTSLPISGGTYYRTYANSGSGPTGEADPATVSRFRLDKYLVTVGRFRRFVNAWKEGSGYPPPAGSGKHAHLNGGRGLANTAAAGTYEPGWLAADDKFVAPTNAHLACEHLATWTPYATSEETVPVNCVNWYEAYAFCIWDGGFLPSEAEWEYAAAGGSEQREYPWGAEAPGTDNRYAIYGDVTDCYYPNGRLAACVGAAPVGTATRGAGLWGQLDLAGDMWEWNLDWWAPYANPCVDCADLTTADLPPDGRVFRGGFWAVDLSGLAPPLRDEYPPTARTATIGFRCARTP